MHQFVKAAYRLSNTRYSESAAAAIDSEPSFDSDDRGSAGRKVGLLSILQVILTTIHKYSSLWGLPRTILVVQLAMTLSWTSVDSWVQM
jgi:hypothetical protein